MIDSVALYLKEWNEACVYARECWPENSFFHFSEPWSFLAVLALVCYIIWRANEQRVKNASN